MNEDAVNCKIKNVSFVFKYNFSELQYTGPLVQFRQHNWSNLGKWHLLKMMTFSQERHVEKELYSAGKKDNSPMSNVLQLQYVCIEIDATAHYSLNVKVTTERRK